MQNNLREFAAHLRNAPTDKEAERIVRIMVQRVAKTCPIHILVQIGQCLIDCRKAELRGEAEQN
jgi:hypothetical protein